MKKVNRNNFIKLTFALIFISGCSDFGTSPDNNTKKNFLASANYNQESKKFENRIPDVIIKDRDKAFNFSTIWEWFKGGENVVPSKKLPEEQVNLEDFLKKGHSVKFIWFGHSTLLINFEGKIILIDPIFSQAASPVSFAAKRFQDPVLKLKSLPKIDFILISHDHYDHLDMETIKFFKNKEVTFITPLGVGSHLKGWGVDPRKIVEKDWLDSFEVDEIQFIATPSQHFSGRSLFDGDKTLWASWVIKSANHKVFFSGDSGYDIHFKMIGEKYGPFDIAFMENGQYDDRWKAAHMVPEEVAKAYKELKAKKVFPIHWGMFALGMHPWNEPPKRLMSAIKEKSEFLIPKIGTLYSLDNLPKLETWWNE